MERVMPVYSQINAVMFFVPWDSVHFTRQLKKLQNASTSMIL
jgi:hypothetical protein